MKNVFEYIILSNEEKLRRHTLPQELPWWKVAIAFLVLPVCCATNIGGGAISISKSTFAFFLIVLAEFSLVGIFAIVHGVVLTARQKRAAQEHSETRDAWEAVLPVLTALSYKQRYAPLTDSEQTLYLCAYAHDMIIDEGFYAFFEQTPIELCFAAKDSLRRLGADRSAAILQEALDCTPFILGEDGEQKETLFELSMTDKIRARFTELGAQFSAAADNFPLLYKAFIEAHNDDIKL